MSFREDVISKVLTYITVAVLLGAMLAEALVIYRERGVREETQGQLETAQGILQDLTQANQELETEIASLQEYKENWEGRLILADDERLVQLRRNLYARKALLPQEAIAAAVLVVERRLEEERERSGEDAPKEEEEGIRMRFSFPDPEERDWLLILDRREGAESSLLLYASALDEEQDVRMELLYEVPVSGTDGEPQRDGMGRIIWNCVAYNVGSGWQACEPAEEGTEDP